ncbi:unnamed protein product, partial [Didymodactylos carnosus]
MVLRTLDLLQPFLTTLDCLVNNALPVFIITMTNMIIIIRVLLHKRKMQRAHTWNKNQKMVAQLLWISIVYILTWIPMTLGTLLTLYASDLPFVSEISIDYISYLTYFAVLVCPMVAIMALPDVRNKLFRPNEAITTTSTIFNLIKDLPARSPQLTLSASVRARVLPSPTRNNE